MRKATPELIDCTTPSKERVTRIEVLFVDRVIEVVINSNDVGDIDLVRIVTPKNR